MEVAVPAALAERLACARRKIALDGGSTPTAVTTKTDWTGGQDAGPIPEPDGQPFGRHHGGWRPSDTLLNERRRPPPQPKARHPIPAIYLLFAPSADCDQPALAAQASADNPPRR